MMKILVISEVFYPENFLINDLALEWKKRGHHIEILTQYPSYPESFVFDGYKNGGYFVEDWNGIKIHRFKVIEGYKDSKVKKFSNYLYFIFKGGQIAKRLKTDFDCIFVSQTGPLTVAYPGIFLKKKNGAKLYIWTCDIWPDVVYSYGVPKNIITNLCLNKLIKSIYNSCDKVFISSEHFRDTISKYFNRKIIYAPNWLQTVKEDRGYITLDRNRINFTFAGNISIYQNLLNTIKGFASANIHNAIFNIFGNGSAAEEIKQYVVNNNIKNVIFHGRVPYNQINDILRQSDILVLPLISNEGIEKTEPLKIQSYLYAGKVIFGVCNGSCREIIEQNNLGICASPDNVIDISDKFKKVVEFYRSSNESIQNSALSLLQNRFNRNKIIDCITDNISH